MGNLKNITELTEVIRSKNAGPFELTFDIIFKNFTVYQKVKEKNTITRDLIAELYNIDPEDVISVITLDAAKAFKVTIFRPVSSGSIGETDVYGAQQHAPLLKINIPWDK